MRTDNERLDELHLRMKMRRREKTMRRTKRIAAAVYAAGGALAALFALLISAVTVRGPGAAGESAAASIFAAHELLGYVVVALLAFCLGALITILCMRRRPHEDGETRDD